MTTKPRLNPKKYAKEYGVHCPNCLSNDIEGGQIDIDAPRARQTIICNTCHASWIDVYVLKYYYDLQEA